MTLRSSPTPFDSMTGNLKIGGASVAISEE